MKKLFTILVAVSALIPALAGPPPYYVAGDFNGWNAAGNVMTETAPGSGIWQLALHLSAGRHEFKFTGGDWIWYYPGPNCWLYTAASGDITITYDANSYSDGWLSATSRIGLSADPGAWTATGDFLGWNNSANNMTALGGGIYQWSKVLTPGTYTWKAVVTGTWDSIGSDCRSVNSAGYTFTVTPEAPLCTFSVDAYKGVVKLAMQSALLWQNIVTEDFEGSFPGSRWQLFGAPTWDDTTYAYHNGTASGWCAASSFPPAGGYANNMDAWMIYGPFSLRDATNAVVNFWYKNYSESGSDFFGWYVSANRWDFYGDRVSGFQNTWRQQAFYLTNVVGLGSLCGRDQVWVAFTFSSDSSIAGEMGFKGAFIDDITIQKEAILPTAPILRGARSTAGGNFGLSLTGAPGAAYVIQAATSLTGSPWTPLITNLSPFIFADPNATNYAQRFYRAVTP